MHVELPQQVEEGDDASAAAPPAGLEVSPDDGSAPDTAPTDEVDPFGDDDPFDGADDEDPFADGSSN